MDNMEEDANILRITRTKRVNCWGYGIKMVVQTTVSDMNKIPEEILPEDVRLRVVVEGKPPICGKKDHIKVWCPQREEKVQQIEQSEEQEIVNDVVKEDEKETTGIEEEFEVVKKRKRKERVGSPPERQKKKIVDKETEEEVAKEVEEKIE
uniref:Uncharacterized protein n=1 Tax=Octopus bimaculoides TaxID=37653 RepID=A0A0L8HQL3_OCTBM